MNQPERRFNRKEKKASRFNLESKRFVFKSLNRERRDGEKKKVEKRKEKFSNVAIVKAAKSMSMSPTFEDKLTQKKNQCR